jgi:hypothetical protein
VGRAVRGGRHRRRGALHGVHILRLAALQIRHNGQQGPRLHARWPGISCTLVGGRCRLGVRPIGCPVRSFSVERAGGCLSGSARYEPSCSPCARENASFFVVLLCYALAGIHRCSNPLAFCQVVLRKFNLTSHKVLPEMLFVVFG